MSHIDEYKGAMEALHREIEAGWLNRHLQDAIYRVVKLNMAGSGEHPSVDASALMPTSMRGWYWAQMNLTPGMRNSHETSIHIYFPFNPSVKGPLPAICEDGSKPDAVYVRVTSRVHESVVLRMSLLTRDNEKTAEVIEYYSALLHDSLSGVSEGYVSCVPLTLRDAMAKRSVMMRLTIIYHNWLNGRKTPRLDYPDALSF